MPPDSRRFCEVALVVFLGLPERLRVLDRGHDRGAEPALLVVDHAAHGLRLLRRVGEDDGAVLVADVGALAVHLGRVVDLEVLADEVLVADLRGVELDLRHLDVAGVAAADLLVGRVVDVAALVADQRVDDAVDGAEVLLDLPEAAGAEGGEFGVSGSCSQSCH